MASTPACLCGRAKRFDRTLRGFRSGDACPDQEDMDDRTHHVGESWYGRERRRRRHAVVMLNPELRKYEGLR